MMKLYSTSFTSWFVVMIAVIAVMNFEAQSEGNTSNQTFSKNSTIDGHEGRFTCVYSNLTFDIDDVCDGQYQCPYSDDEYICDNEYCSSVEYLCDYEYTYQCLPLSYVCDGYPDCERNGIDEILCDPLDCVPSCRCSAYNVSCEGPNIVDDTNIRKSTRGLYFIGESINGTKMPLSMPFNVTTYPLLVQLNISNTGLRELLRADFMTLTELIYMLLPFNNISRIEDHSFSNLNKLTTLDLSNNAIRELRKGMFDDQSYLTFLYLEDNQISNIDLDAFKGLHNLETIVLSNNAIRELRKGMFDDQSNLTFLDLTQNQISNIDVDAFKGLHSLVEMDLSNNSIRELRKGMFDDQSNLEWLDLKENQISNIDIDAFKGLHTLELIDLSNNAIRELRKGMFDDQSNLIFLYLEDNQISNIDLDAFKGLHTLETIDLSNNGIRELRKGMFDDQSNLIFLYLEDNQISNIDLDTFKGLHTLETIDLSYNGIRELRKGMFDDQSNLTFLNLTQNQISNIDVDAFKGLHSLEEIDLSNNSIRELRKGMFDDQSNLEWLYFTNNLLEYIEPGTFRNLSRLSGLFMYSNSITSLPSGVFRGLESIIYLDFTENKISNIDIDAFKGLHTLENISLSNNLIRELRKGMFDDQSNLVWLPMHSNSITSLPSGAFRGLESISFLGLTFNQISNIDIDAFKGLHTLEVIQLTNNSIRELRKGMFDDQSNLISLYLSFNPLHYIEPGTFQNLSRLEYLNMVNVQLANLEPDTFKGITSLKFLSTDDYRLCCLFDETDLCNIASSNFLDTCSRLMPNTILRTAMWAIGWGALIGNTIVIVLRCRTDHSVSAKTQGLFIFNLAIADFLMGVYMIIISSADVYYGEYFYLFAVQWRGSVTCKVAGFIAVLSSETSIFILAIITIDRVLNVVFPFGKLKFRATSARVGVALVWTIAVLVSIVPLIVSSYTSGFYGLSDVCVGLPLNVESRETGETGGLVHNYETGLWEKPQYDTTKRPSWVYSIALFLGINFLIFILILVSYVVIFVNIRKSARSVANPAGGSGSIDRAREVKMATRMAIIVLTDFFCWMPVIIMGILSQTGAVTLPVSLYAWSVVFILPINASINPYLYTFIAIFDGSKTRST